MVDYIKSLHEGWSDEVMTVLDATPPDSVEQRDLYDRPPELLRSWADGNVVLMGDAVHPMMPNLGQVSPSMKWSLRILNFSLDLLWLANLYFPHMYSAL